MTDGAPKVYEDDDFTAAESPKTLDFLADIGRHARSFIVLNNGPGIMLISYSRDGVAFSDPWKILAREQFSAKNVFVQEMRLVHAADTSYRIKAE